MRKNAAAKAFAAAFFVAPYKKSPPPLTGTADIFKTHIPRITPGKVTIEFGEPIILKELPPEERKFAGAYTRKRIMEMLEKEK